MREAALWLSIGLALFALTSPLLFLAGWVRRVWRAKSIGPERYDKFVKAIREDRRDLGRYMGASTVGASVGAWSAVFFLSREDAKVFVVPFGFLGMVCAVTAAKVFRGYLAERIRWWRFKRAGNRSK